MSYRYHSKGIILYYMMLPLLQKFQIWRLSRFVMMKLFIYGSEFWTMYNWVQTWGKIKISEVLRATYLA